MNEQKQKAVASLSADDILLYFSCIHQGDWHAIFNSIQQRAEIDKNLLEEIKAKTKHKFITICSPEYPLWLKRVIYPPYLLFYEGDLSLLAAENIVAMVGARKCSEYGRRMANNISSKLASSGYVIASGLAQGIDAECHAATLKVKGKTIAVVGQGLDLCYPLCNTYLYKEIVEQGGLILSEYPDDTLPKAVHFPARNRLIAAISKACIVVEAATRSGALITVRFALELGKEVYCVPERAEVHSGCNQLIKEGARLIESAADFIEADHFCC